MDKMAAWDSGGGTNSHVSHPNQQSQTHVLFKSNLTHSLILRTQFQIGKAPDGAGIDLFHWPD